MLVYIMYVSKYYIIIDNEFNFCFILKNICGAPGGAEKILHYSTHFGVLSMCFFAIYTCNEYNNFQVFLRY